MTEPRGRIQRIPRRRREEGLAVGGRDRKRKACTAASVGRHGFRREIGLALFLSEAVIAGAGKELDRVGGARCPSDGTHDCPRAVRSGGKRHEHRRYASWGPSDADTGLAKNHVVVDRIAADQVAHSTIDDHAPVKVEGDHIRCARGRAADLRIRRSGCELDAPLTVAQRLGASRVRADVVALDERPGRGGLDTDSGAEGSLAAGDDVASIGGCPTDGNVGRLDFDSIPAARVVVPVASVPMKSPVTASSPPEFKLIEVEVKPPNARPETRLPAAEITRPVLGAPSGLGIIEPSSTIGITALSPTVSVLALCTGWL